MDSEGGFLLQIAFIAGVMYTLVGIFSLGWITNFLAHSVIAGFMTGASVIIGLGQVQSLQIIRFRVRKTRVTVVNVRGSRAD